MKKIIAFFAVLVLVLSMSGISSFADNVTTLSLKDTTCAPGDTVGLTVELNNNKGLWGMLFSVGFDPDCFAFCEARNNNDVFSTDAYMIGPSDFSQGKVNVLITPSELTKNNTKNGKVCTIFFKVGNDMPEGEYNFNLTLSEKDICDVNGNKVEVNAVSGKVKIDKSYKPKTTQNTAKAGEVLATTASGKNADSKGENQTAHFENITEVSNVYVTNKKGETLTNKNGKKITKKVFVDKDTGEIIGDVDSEKNEKSDEKIEVITDENGKKITNKNDSTDEENGFDYSVIVLIAIFGAVIICCVVVAVIKTKKKKHDK